MSYTNELSELNKQNQELKSELYDIEVLIGHKIIKDSNTTIEPELKSEYFSIQSDLEAKNKDLEISKELEKSINDAEDEIATEKKSIAESEKKLDSMLLDLGITLYGNYTSDLTSTFGIHYAEINQEIKNIEDINIQKEILKQEMEKQGFFSKLMTQTKVAGLNMSLSSHTKKKEEALKKGAKVCLENGVITPETGGESYIECANIKTAIETSTKRISLLTDEISKSKEKLNSMEKENKLKQQIEELSGKLNSVANQLGHVFDKQYVTRDAEVLVEFPKGFEEELNKVLDLKKQLKIVNRKCEIVQLSGQIEAAEKNVETINEEISENKAKIAELSERNENLSKRLAEAEDAKKTLVEKRTVLEEEAKAETDSSKA